MSIADWPFWAVIGLFILATCVIGVAGVRMTRLADRLADVTGLGEAIFGAVFLGITTSLSGSITSIVSAYQGYPELAVSNSIGGIAAQTAFLALADITYRNINLEHAAASVENLMQGGLLMLMLALPLTAMSIPSLTVWQIHPLSLLLVVVYIFGLRQVSQARAAPLWQPKHTAETRVDVPESDAQAITGAAVVTLWLRFILLMLIVGAAGYTVAETGMSISDRSGLSQTVVGALFTAVATSLPELVTALAAVRQRALTLAVGNIIGGNSFDVLFLAFADVSYRGGSIYHAISDRQLFVIAIAQVMTAVLVLGLLRREKRGIANIGFESFLVLVIYLVAVAVLFMAP
ncbi:cation transporter [Candidatus Tenderia electrophaga]|jgi:cation:H+ antiporter|uniref:Cation transporter n=1 Tax=Candidatus Tenderia electrophaga TaxID=1748243 RepID=A0A0S2TFI7_9GAMM|nr:cation transporter [Candidatus Tenderia electrophaga]